MISSITLLCISYQHFAEEELYSSSLYILSSWKLLTDDPIQPLPVHSSTDDGRGKKEDQGSLGWERL